MMHTANLRRARAVAAWGSQPPAPPPNTQGAGQGCGAPETMRAAAATAIWAALLLAGLSQAVVQLPPPQPPGGLVVFAPTNAGLAPRRLPGFGRTHYYQKPGAGEGRAALPATVLAALHVGVPPHLLCCEAACSARRPQCSCSVLP